MPKSTKVKKSGYKQAKVKKSGSKRKKWIKIGHRRPGRPKGSRNRVKDDLSKILITTALGWCPGCEGIIAKADLVTKRKYVCPGCQHRASISGLKQALNHPRPGSKKEYMENTRVIQHLDTPPLLKVIEEMPDVEVIQEEDER
jgi:hypothetical protein